MTATVLLVREQPDSDAPALERAGLLVRSEPYLAITPCRDPEASTRASRLLTALREPQARLVCASSNGIRALVHIAGEDRVRQALDGARTAAVGPATAAAIRAAGGRGECIVPTEHTAMGLLAALRALTPATAVLPRSDIGGQVLGDGLRALGWDVVAETVYRTRPVTRIPHSAVDLTRGHFAAIVLRSPSAVDAVLHFAGAIPADTSVIAGGPTTAAAARARGITIAGVAADSTPDAVAVAVSKVLEVRRG